MTNGKNNLLKVVKIEKKHICLTMFIANKFFPIDQAMKILISN